jgi:hypothetical protein
VARIAIDSASLAQRWYVELGGEVLDIEGNRQFLEEERPLDLTAERCNSSPTGLFDTLVKNRSEAQAFGDGTRWQSFAGKLRAEATIPR